MIQNVNPTAFRRLVREIKQLQTEPPEGIRITTDEENILDVTGIIQGPGMTATTRLLSEQDFCFVYQLTDHPFATSTRGNPLPRRILPRQVQVY